MKNIYILITALTFISCDLGDSYSGFVQDNDAKSEIVVKLADSYLAGNFDIAREYFTPDGKHLFNNLEFDEDYWLSQYEGTVSKEIDEDTYNKIKYGYSWVWDGDKIASTTCYVDPAAIFEEAAIYAESQN